MSDNLSEQRSRFHNVITQIQAAEQRFQRPAGSVRLLAVSKTRQAEEIRNLASLGQREFGESYLQEALDKICELGNLDLVWHFIGPIQSNKTRHIAENFAWVHSVDRLKIAQRLSAQRPPELPPLNICLQINVSHENSKSGIDLSELPALAREIVQLPNLKLRGLMAIPAPSDDFEQARRPFRQLHEALMALKPELPELDTLSMGMSGDLQAAIAEGATIVRVGTALFGTRQTKKPLDNL